MGQHSLVTPPATVILPLSVVRVGGASTMNSCSTNTVVLIGTNTARNKTLEFQTLVRQTTSEEIDELPETSIYFKKVSHGWP